MEALYRDYRGQGSGRAPCNQFAGQEPGTEGEIKDFCATTFGVDFPMTAKVDVKGGARHPFHAWAEEKLGPPCRCGTSTRS
jgi:glutathione peroxidase